MAVLDLAASSSEGLGDRYRQVVGPLSHLFHRHPNELLVCDAVAGQQLTERIVADRRGPGRRRQDLNRKQKQRSCYNVTHIIREANRNSKWCCALYRDLTVLSFANSISYGNKKTRLTHVFLCLVQDNFLTQHVLEPTRAARVLDIVLSSQKEFVDNVEIHEPLGSSDHNQLHFNINIKSDKTKVKQCRRDFRKGNYMEIRKSLAHIKWDDKMKNKTATECWNILRVELDSAIDSCAPMKKQGKRSKKKHLSKEAFKKIIYKQSMWRVYKHTGKDKDYEVYKEALNAATNEVRKSKRDFEHKLAQNIKSDSKSFYAYVRSKQKVRDKVGQLEDNAGIKITQGCLMAEELNKHFSSVFTREDTSSLPVPETKFNGSEGERLGQLIVTPEVVASKIKNMKENKSPGVDGLSPKILKETVEQISKPLAHVFNMSLQEGIVPLEWKEANIIPLFKKGSRNKSVNYRPVSLTSVICKLLETIIRDHMMDFLVKHKLINPSQHGFLKARSCLTNLLCFFRK